VNTREPGGQGHKKERFQRGERKKGADGGDGSDGLSRTTVPARKASEQTRSSLIGTIGSVTGL
jgi:hypothetical protein